MNVRKLLETRSSSNVSEATVQLLKSLKVPVTTSTAIEQVENHPDFPSLYSISDSLTSWNIENAAFQVDAESLDRLPTPFISHMRKQGGSFVLVTNINGAVQLIDEKGQEKKLSREEFIKGWTSNVLLAERNTHSGEKEYAKKRREELIAGVRLPLLGGIALLLIIYFFILRASTPFGAIASLLLMTKFIGCVVSSLLLWFEVDKASPVLKQICTAGNKTNCTAVLNSKGSKVFNWLSWSEAGFFYFAGSFLSLLLSIGFPNVTLAVLTCLSMLAFPYTFFSIYYQWRIVKQWCPLCLVVQMVIVTEAIIGYFGYWRVASNPLIVWGGSQLLFFLAVFSLPVLFWIASKKAFLSLERAKLLKKELHKLKYNKEIFTALLPRQKHISHPTEGLGITLGNPAAKHTIVKVCNPFCGPCAKAHQTLDELLDNGQIKVKVIFMAADGEGDKAMVVKHLLHLSEKGDEALLRRAMDDWYNAPQKDYAVFQHMYPVEREQLKRYGQQVEAMKNWCLESSISFTPTIFINGYQMPDNYKIEDLMHLL